MLNATRSCAVCGNTDMPIRRNAVVCSSECRYQHFQVARRADPRSRWSPLHLAVEAGDSIRILAEIRSRSTLTEVGCWEWDGSKRSGYAMAFVGSPQPVHRISLEAKCGRPLGDQAAHHICANPPCVNPDHLQPVTAAENTAEMLARTYMTRRIRDLEEALRRAAPEHDLLKQVGVVET